MKMRVFTFIICMTGFGLTGLAQEEDYKPGPDAQRKDGVPKGTVTTYLWESKIYPGTKRNYYVYVPAQYTSDKPAALMVFQDGHAYLKEDGDFRTTIVYDNLIYRKELPITICLFVDPGYPSSQPAPDNFFRSSNRSFEYDDLSDQYASFIITELVPELKKKYNISDDPKMHGIGGLSSGAICAFTAAWTHPEFFHKVLSHIGSYTDIRGGHVYPTLIRKSSNKNIRIFLQDGNKDLSNIYGDWWLANLQMESAFKFKGYDYKFVSSNGSHNGRHAGSILPESLRWLWNESTQK